MRFPSVALFCFAFLAWLVTSRPLHHPQSSSPTPRGLLGLLSFEEGNPPTTTPDGSNALHTTQTTANQQTPITSGRPTGVIATTTTPALSTSPIFTPASTTRFASISASFMDPATVTFPSASVEIGYVADAPTTPPAELTEWKVIGVAVITVTFIGTIILAVSFFNSWWGFVCDACCGGRGRGKGGSRELAGEKVVPDWEKRGWAFRLASEGGHRYPTMSSLESIAKEKDKAGRDHVKAEAGLGLTTPRLAYGGI